jgi:hypothetical protein
MRISRCAYTYYIWKERNNRGVHNVGVFTIDLTLKNSTVQAVQCRLHNTTISKEALFNSKFPETCHLQTIADSFMHRFLCVSVSLSLFLNLFSCKLEYVFFL